MTIQERPSRGAYRIDAKGKSVEREFTVWATSKVQAEALLRRQGIIRRTIYRDFLGNRPDPFLVCEEIEIAPDGQEVMGDENNAYIATVRYRSATTSRTGSEIVPGGPAVISLQQSLEGVEADVDVEGTPVQTTAGVPFEEPLRSSRTSEVVVFEWIRTDLNFYEAVAFNRRFANKINSKEFLGAPKHCLMCHGLAPVALTNEAFSGPGPIKFQAKLEFRPEKTLHGTTYGGFIQTRLNMGRSERNPNYVKGSTDPEKRNPTRPIMEGAEDSEDYRQVQVPVLLTSAGYVQTDPEAAPVVLSWRDLEEENFNEIEIPIAKVVRG